MITDFDLKVVCAISTLAGVAAAERWCHSERQGFQPPLWSLDQQEGHELIQSWFVHGSHSPCGTWQAEEWKGNHSIIPFATQDQGKHPGRHIPGTLDSLYCQSIAKSVKLTEISTSLWRRWESTRDSQHEVVENQSWYEKESWLNPSLKELVLRFWVT